MRIGFVPEHFSTPLAFADREGLLRKRGIDHYELFPFPSGSGHLIQALKRGEVDVVLGLTEAFVRGMAQGDNQYDIVGEYVQSPLCWSVSTGKSRDLTSLKDLPQNAKIGVSRIGSGSYVMSYVLALKEGLGPFEYEVQNTFENLRKGVNDETTDAFMWEYFTSKPYYDSGEIKPIGEIYTPWASWVVVAANSVAKDDVTNFLAGLQDGIEYYKGHQDEALDYILAELDYNDRGDLEEWARRVKFSDNVATFDRSKLVGATLDVLKTAKVVE